MSQEIHGLAEDNRKRLLLPGPEEMVMEGVVWGNHYAIFTPAFWATLAWMDEGLYESHRLGRTLEEEIAACLLGGHGIPAEVGLAAFYRLRDKGLLCGAVASEKAIFKELSAPLMLGNRRFHYRFARQRSIFLSEALMAVSTSLPPSEYDLEFRSWLLNLKGVGPKTASWITRNWLNSDKVAIIDIHIYRAGLMMGLFGRTETPAKNYFEMERKFLTFADRIAVRPSRLDALIWRQMKDAGNIALEVLERLQDS